MAHRREQALIARGFVASRAAPQREVRRHPPFHHVSIGEFVVAVRHFYAVDDQLEAGRYAATLGIRYQTRQRGLVGGILGDEDATGAKRVDRVSDQQIE